MTLFSEKFKHINFDSYNSVDYKLYWIKGRNKRKRKKGNKHRNPKTK